VTVHVLVQAFVALTSVVVVAMATCEEDSGRPLLQNSTPGAATASPVIDDASSDCSSMHDLSDSDMEDPHKQRLPDDEGRYYDDGLWYGKTLDEIRGATEHEKTMGNDLSKSGDWHAATKCWKNSLKGAEKLNDVEMEIRLRLNLALGYTKQQKTSKALEHCAAIFKERLKGAATPQLRSKAHYRRAEAFEVAGEIEKAMSSIRAALDVQSDNVDARRKWTALKQVTDEQRQRERSLYVGKLTSEPRAEVSVASLQSSAEQPSEEEMVVADKLTDRAAATHLTSLLTSHETDAGSLNAEFGCRENCWESCTSKTSDLDMPTGAVDEK